MKPKQMFVVYYYNVELNCFELAQYLLYIITMLN